MNRKEEPVHMREANAKPEKNRNHDMERQKKSPLVITILFLVIFAAVAVLIMIIPGLVRAERAGNQAGETIAVPAVQTTEPASEVTPEQTETPVETPKPLPEDVYREILEKYASAAGIQADAQILAEWGLNPMTANSYSGNGLQHTGYLMDDMDGDNIPELLIGSLTGDPYTDQIILELYTIKEDRAVKVFSSGERDRYYLCVDGMIANEASSSAYESVFSYYRYIAGELKMQEKIVFDVMSDRNQPWNHEDSSGVKAPLTEEEAIAEINAKKESYITVSYTSFSAWQMP